MGNVGLHLGGWLEQTQAVFHKDKSFAKILLLGRELWRHRDSSVCPHFIVTRFSRMLFLDSHTMISAISQMEGTAATVSDNCAAVH